jgi:hypothetical protein
LREGDELRTEAGGWLPVQSLQVEGGDTTVYNLYVPEYHTYFVGCQDWGFAVWVHNAPPNYEGNLEAELARVGEGEAAAAGNAPKSVSLLRGSQEGAATLQSRAAELNALRRPWEANNGTTAVIKVQNKVTGETKTLIATEGKTMPKEFAGKLGPGEEFIGEVGHAEQTILKNLGPDWVAVEGGASRNVCSTTCQPLVEGSGMTLGGPEFRGAADKTRFRMFWKP